MKSTNENNKNRAVTINKYTQKLNQPGLKFLADGSIVQLTWPSSKTDKPAQPQTEGQLWPLTVSFLFDSLHSRESCRESCRELLGAKSSVLATLQKHLHAQNMSQEHF